MSNQIKKRQPTFTKVENLKPGQHGYNVYVKVLEAKVSEYPRRDGSTLQVVDAVLGDQTASVNARFTGDFAGLFKVGAVLAIRNGRSEVFQERQRLEVDKFGKITAETVTIASVNSEKNLSNTLYEVKLVQNEKKKRPQRK